MTSYHALKRVGSLGPLSGMATLFFVGAGAAASGCWLKGAGAFFPPPKRSKKHLTSPRSLMLVVDLLMKMGEGCKVGIGNNHQHLNLLKPRHSSITSSRFTRDEGCRPVYVAWMKMVLTIIEHIYLLLLCLPC